MKILVDDNHLITAYATVGGFDGDIEVDESILPNNFADDFAPKRFTYLNGTVTYNKNFDPNPVVQDTPSYEQRLSELEQQMKEVQSFINNQPQA
ncbi:hypothetical protein HpBTM60_25190 [Helicobacter pylori]